VEKIQLDKTETLSITSHLSNEILNENTNNCSFLKLEDKEDLKRKLIDY